MLLSKLYFIISLLAVFGATGWYAYNTYTSMERELELAKENSVRLQSAMETTTASIEKLQEQNKVYERENRSLQTKLQKAEQYGDELRDKLNNHDLTKLSAKKPGLIEKRINNATAKIFQELEDITATSSTN